jgi:hypothetical protein
LNITSSHNDEGMTLIKEAISNNTQNFQNNKLICLKNKHSTLLSKLLKLKSKTKNSLKRKRKFQKLGNVNKNIK